MEEQGSDGVTCASSCCSGQYSRTLGNLQVLKVCEVSSTALLLTGKGTIIITSECFRYPILTQLRKVLSSFRNCLHAKVSISSLQISLWYGSRTTESISDGQLLDCWQCICLELQFMSVIHGADKHSQRLPQLFTAMLLKCFQKLLKLYSYSVHKWSVHDLRID